MKTHVKIATLLAAAILFAACGEKTPQTNVEHDIFYTVSESPAISMLGAGGNTVHLTTDDELDALLDLFCDYAQDGDQVMFCNTVRPQSKDATSSSPTSITTTNREELKTWMKEMEKMGKTVRITFDDGTGTWHGNAYVNLGQNDMQQVRTYNGTLVYVPAPAMEVPPMGGVVGAMQTSADSTLVITVHGMLMWFDSIDDNMRLLEGATMSLEGVAGTYTDLENNQFMTLSLNVE